MKNEIKVLAHGEVFTCEVWEGRHKPLVMCDIYTKQGTTKNIKNESAICIKKHNARNINQGQYYPQFLFTYKNNIYEVSINRKGGLVLSVPKVSNSVYAHKVALTDEEKTSIKEYLKEVEQIKNISERSLRLNNAISEHFNNVQEKYKNARENFNKLSIEDIKKHVFNIDNWNVRDMDRMYNNKVYIIYACTFEGITIVDKTIYTQEKPARLTKKVKIELIDYFKNNIKLFLNEESTQIKKIDDKVIINMCKVPTTLNLEDGSRITELCY